MLIRKLEQGRILFENMSFLHVGVLGVYCGMSNVTKFHFLRTYRLLDDLLVIRIANGSELNKDLKNFSECTALLHVHYHATILSAKTFTS